MIHSSPIEARHAAESLVRYRSDFRSFASEQLKVLGLPLNFWPCQLPLLVDVERQMKEQGFVRSVWLKSRQVGASTLAQAIVAWRAMLWPNISAIVIADEAKRSETLFEISRSFYDNLSPEIRPVGRYVSKRELVFANPSAATRQLDPGLRSRIVIDSAHKRSIAIGASWQIAHLSEVSRFRDPSFVIDGVIPAVHRVPGTIIIMESSAEMAGTWYRDFCEDAQHGRNAFSFQFVPWILQPEYFICPVCRKNFCTDTFHAQRALKSIDLGAEERVVMKEYGLKPGHILWMREKLAEMGNDWNLFRQNYPLSPDDAWITPGVQVFPAKALREQRQNIKAPIRHCEIYPGPRICDAPMGKLWVWEEPQVGKQYDIGVDVALGGREAEDDDTGDFSIACVLERGSNKQVAEWSSKTLDPFELATPIYWLGTYYNQAQIAIETNGIGGATNQQLMKMGYVNIYVWRYRDEVSPRFSKKIGWETNRRSKPWLVGFATHSMLNNKVVVRSELLYKELESFVQKGPQEWGAAAGCHDDRCLAWMIALLISDDENFEAYFGLQKELKPGTTNTDGSKRVPEPWECDATFNKKETFSMDDILIPWE